MCVCEYIFKNLEVQSSTSNNWLCVKNVVIPFKVINSKKEYTYTHNGIGLEKKHVDGPIGRWGFCSMCYTE